MNETVINSVSVDLSGCSSFARNVNGNSAQRWTRLVCPLADARLGETSRPADTDGEWLLVDERAPVEVTEAR